MRALSTVLCLLVFCGCRTDARLTEEAAAEQKAGKDRATLRPVAAVDGFGYASGNYKNAHNHPVIFASRGERKFVFMGAHGRGEAPLADPKKAIALYEELLLHHGYEPNGKPSRAENMYVTIDGGTMVVVPSDQIFRQMPSDLTARFTSDQYAVLRSTSGIEIHSIFSGYYGDRDELPSMCAYSSTIVVNTKNVRREFAMAKASDAFADYEAVLKSVGMTP